MIRRCGTVLIVALLFMLQAFPKCLAADDGCDTWRSRWVAAFERLKQSTDSIRQLKEGSLASRIQQELSTHRNAASLARSVRAVLKERSAALKKERSTCHSLAKEENEAFSQWRRCAVRGNSRRRGFQAHALDAAAVERKRLLGSLQDLLMDEAYVQYKDYRQPTPPEYSGSGQQPWGFGQNLGYRSYPGYGGYR